MSNSNMRLEEIAANLNRRRSGADAVAVDEYSGVVRSARSNGSIDSPNHRNNEVSRRVSQPQRVDVTSGSSHVRSRPVVAPKPSGHNTRTTRHVVVDVATNSVGGRISSGNQDLMTALHNSLTHRRSRVAAHDDGEGYDSSALLGANGGVVSVPSNTVERESAASTVQWYEGRVGILPPMAAAQVRDETDVVLPQPRSVEPESVPHWHERHVGMPLRMAATQEYGGDTVGLSSHGLANGVAIEPGAVGRETHASVSSFGALDVSHHHVGYTALHGLNNTLEKYDKFEVTMWKDKLCCVADIVKDRGRYPERTNVCGMFDLRTHTPMQCEVRFNIDDSGACASLLVKGVLLSMQACVSETKPYGKDWLNARGLRNISNVGLLTRKEYELLRILNQPFPYLDKEVMGAEDVWSYVRVRGSDLNVGRPKGEHINNEEIWPIFQILCQKLGLFASLDRVVLDVLGLAEYLSSIEAKVAVVGGFVDGTRQLDCSLVDTPSYDIAIEKLVYASVIQGDEMLLIRNECAGMYHIVQWDTLMRSSTLLAEGGGSKQASSLARAILAARGYDYVVFPSNKHCGNDLRHESIIHWMWNAHQMEVKYVPEFENTIVQVVDSTVRVAVVLSVDHFANMCGYSYFTDFRENGSYRMVMVINEDGSSSVTENRGRAMIIMIKRRGSIAVITKFGRYRVRVRMSDVDSIIRAVSRICLADVVSRRANISAMPQLMAPPE